MLCSRKWSILFGLTVALVTLSAVASAVEPLNDEASGAAERLFRAMEAKLAKAKTLGCILEIQCDFGGQREALSYKGSLLLGEGNRARQEIKAPAKGLPMRLLMVSDGARLSMQDDGMSRPTIGDTPKSLNRDILTWLARSGVFLPHAPLPDVEAHDAKDRFPVSGFKFGNKEKIGDYVAQGIEYQLAIKGQDPKFSVTVWLDSATGLPVKRLLTSQVGNEKITVIETYSKFSLDEKVDAKRFDLPK